ncbi:MAG TPA: AAA family ATPase [Phycisphaerales bacterium]|nr:AAA family ATPase [Phycisphaerales bacterium]
MFGLTTRLAVESERGGARTITIVPRTDIDLPVPGPGIVFISGPSGSGKSTLLGLMVEACTARGVRVLTTMPSASIEAASDDEDHDRAVIDLVAPDRPLTEALELLSLAGLGDAFIMLRRPHELSDGQRLRFHIAQMMAAARESGDATPTVLAIDEFAATLDRITARNLSRNLRRWSDRSGVAIVLATTHDDLIEPLVPDVLIRKGLGAAIDVTAPRPRGAAASRTLDPAQAAAISADADEFRIEPGTLADYRALASFHYRSHHPGAATSVLRIRAGGSEPLLVGVLVRSLPHLNAAARDVALHHRYATLSQRERGIVLNREIRCISRVVIDPRFRGMGLAVRLVRHALEHPESARLRYTEALAAMGRVSPFFERARMQRFDLPEACRPAHARLLDALQHVGLTAHDLSRDQEESAAAALDRNQRRWLVSEARRFLRATRRLSSAQMNAMSERDTLAAAAERLLLQPVYYVYSHRGDAC